MGLLWVSDFHGSLYNLLWIYGKLLIGVPTRRLRRHRLDAAVGLHSSSPLLTAVYNYSSYIFYRISLPTTYKAKLGFYPTHAMYATNTTNAADATTKQTDES